MKNKYAVLSIAVILVGVLIAGGTYAYLTLSANVTGGNYSGTTACFLVDYNIDNGDNTQDITGTLFPTLGPSGGLSGKVSMAINATCNMSGTGSLVLHINTTTSSQFGTKATPRCESKLNSQVLTEYTTESACLNDENGDGVWRYPTSYCEDRDTLEYLKEYRSSSTCSSNNGTWTTNGASLKYAVYNNSTATGTPLKVGYFDASKIGTDMTLYDNFTVTHDTINLYVYIWLDGHLADDTFTNLPFDAYIKASVTQNEQLLPSAYQQVEYLESTGAQYIDTGVVFDNNYDISVKFRTPQNIPTSGVSTVIFFSGDSSNNGNYGFAMSSREIDGKYRAFIGSTYNATTMLNSLTDYTVSFSNFNLYINNELINTFSNKTFVSPYSMPLLAQYWNNDTNPVSYAPAGTRLYYVKIYYSGNLIRNLIPCYLKSGGRSNGTRGLYDTVTGTFYTNDGTGTFEIGPDV